MKVKAILSTLFALLCFLNPVDACMCGTSKTISSYDLDNYAHISLAKIKNIKPDPDYSDSAEIYYHIVEFEPIEIFKGESLEEVFVQGSNPLAGYKKWSSCDIKMQPNEEWLLLIQKIKGKNTIKFCSKSDLIKSKKGLRRWESNGINKNLKLLRTTVFPEKKYPDYAIIPDGIKRNFSILQDKLNCKRIIKMVS